MGLPYINRWVEFGFLEIIQTIKLPTILDPLSTAVKVFPSQNPTQRGQTHEAGQRYSQ